MMLSLLFSTDASAATFHVSTTAQLEEAIASANANTEANTIVLAGGSYLPGPTTLTFTNKHGLQTVEGPTQTPEAVIGGTNVELEHPELFVIGEGVSVKFRDVVINHAGAGVSAAIEDIGTLAIEASAIVGDQGTSLLVAPTGSSTITNSTLSEGSDAGVVNDGGTVTLHNDTIALNKTGDLETWGR